MHHLITRFFDWLAAHICGPVAPTDDGLWF